MIETRDLVFAYDDTPVLDHVTLTIHDGEYVILTGPNAAGKTTLIHHFNGLLTPDTGTVHVNGTRVQTDLVNARTSVGMVFQNPGDGFVAPTLGEDVAFGPENLGLPRDVINRRVHDALDAVRLTGRSGDRIGRLSGGEQARAAIAGALAMRPDHLVLDEPLRSLDYPSRQSVVTHLARLHQDGTSIVLVTQDLHDVHEHADRIIVMNNGRTTTAGPPSEVTTDLESYGVRPPC